MKNFIDFLRQALRGEADRRRADASDISAHLEKLAADVDGVKWDAVMLDTFEMNVSREAVVEAVQNIVPGWPEDAVTFLKSVFTHAMVTRKTVRR
jgi:hypothetical protein